MNFLLELLTASDWPCSTILGSAFLSGNCFLGNYYKWRWWTSFKEIAVKDYIAVADRT